ncbi:hypothetical protein NFI96_018421, partial [Prochilodus magdalenae]
VSEVSKELKMPSVPPVPCPIRLGTVKSEGPPALLHTYVLERDLRKLEKLLRRGVEVDSENNLGQTPLFCASLLGFTSVVELLLQYGADPNHRCADRSTPVHAAVFSCNPWLLSALLDAGGDLRLHDDQGRTPGDWAEAGAQEHSPRMLDFLKSCESHMRSLTQTHSPQVGRATPTSSKTLLRSPSLLELLRPGGSDLLVNKKLSTKSSVSDVVQCFGYGKLCVEKSRLPVGLLASVPLIADSELVQAEDEALYSFSCGSSCCMTNYSWRGCRVTVKELQTYASQRHAEEDLHQDLLIAELEHASRLFHPHLLQLVAVSVPADLRRSRLVYERVHVGSLHTVLYHRRVEFPVLQVCDLLSLVLQVCEALLYLHSRALVLRALSSHAVIIVHPGVAKVTGLGFMVTSDGSGPGNLSCLPLPPGLYNWAAPEAIRRRACTGKADLYSLCTLIQELYTDAVPWGCVDPRWIKQAVDAGQALSADPAVPQPYYQLLQSGLQPRAQDRTCSLQDIRYTLRCDLKELSSRQDSSGVRPLSVGKSMRTRSTGLREDRKSEEPVIITCHHLPLIITGHHLPLITCHHLPLIITCHHLPLIITCHHLPLIITCHHLPLITCHHLPLIITGHHLPLINCHHLPLIITYHLSSPVITYNLSSPVITYHLSSPVITYHLSTVITYHLSLPVITYHLSPVITYHLSSPVITYHVSSPVITYHLSPVITYQLLSPVITYQLSSPVITYHLSPVITYHLSLPVIAYHLSPVITYHLSPVITYQLSSPVITYHLSSPVITYQLSSPVITYHLSSPVITYHLSPVITYHLSSPVITYHLSSPVITYHLSSPVITYHLSPVITYHLSSPVITYHLSTVITYHLSSPTTYHYLPLIITCHHLQLIVTCHHLPLIITGHHLPLIVTCHHLPLIITCHHLPLITCHHLPLIITAGQQPTDLLEPDSAVDREIQDQLRNLDRLLEKEAYTSHTVQRDDTESCTDTEELHQEISYRDILPLDEWRMSLCPPVDKTSSSQDTWSSSSTVEEDLATRPSGAMSEHISAIVLNLKVSQVLLQQVESSLENAESRLTDGPQFDELDAGVSEDEVDGLGGHREGKVVVLKAVGPPSTYRPLLELQGGWQEWGADGAEEVSHYCSAGEDSFHSPQGDRHGPQRDRRTDWRQQQPIRITEQPDRPSSHEPQQMTTPLTADHATPKWTSQVSELVVQMTRGRLGAPAGAVGSSDSEDVEEQRCPLVDKENPHTQTKLEKLFRSFAGAHSESEESTDFHTINPTVTMQESTHAEEESSSESDCVESPVEPSSMFYTPKHHPDTTDTTESLSQTLSSEEDLDVTMEVCRPSTTVTEGPVLETSFRGESGVVTVTCAIKPEKPDQTGPESSTSVKGTFQTTSEVTDIADLSSITCSPAQLQEWAGQDGAPPSPHSMRFPPCNSTPRSPGPDHGPAPWSRESVPLLQTLLDTSQWDSAPDPSVCTDAYATANLGTSTTTDPSQSSALQTPGVMDFPLKETDTPTTGNREFTTASSRTEQTRAEHSGPIHRADTHTTPGKAGHVPVTDPQGMYLHGRDQLDLSGVPVQEEEVFHEEQTEQCEEQTVLDGAVDSQTAETGPSSGAPASLEETERAHSTLDEVLHRLLVDRVENQKAPKEPEPSSEETAVRDVGEDLQVREEGVSPSGDHSVAAACKGVEESEETSLGDVVVLFVFYR